MLLQKNFSKHMTNDIENIHHSSDKYLLSTYHALDTVLGIRDNMVENTTDNPSTTMELTVQWAKAGSERN